MVVGRNTVGGIALASRQNSMLFCIDMEHVAEIDVLVEEIFPDADEELEFEVFPLGSLDVSRLVSPKTAALK